MRSPRLPPGRRTPRRETGAAAALRSPFLPTGLVVVVATVDAVMAAGPLPLLPMGLLDECGHLSTAALVLRACTRWSTLRRHPVTVLSALAGSVLIDADHNPLYAGVPHIAADGRPYSHSLATVVVLLAASALSRRRRSLLRGAALGVTLHFVRDVAIGPGVALWWPISATDVRLSYRLYLAAVVALAVVATVRAVGELRAGREDAEALGPGESGSRGAVDLSMTERLNDPGVIRTTLTTPATWAVVGLSSDRSRTAYSIAGWLKDRLGQRVIPIHPRAEQVREEPGYRSLADIPDGERVAVVDVFVNSSRAGAIVDEAIAQRDRLGIETLWLQLGVIDPAAAQRAEEAGLSVVMDTCPKIELPRLLARSHS